MYQNLFDLFTLNKSIMDYFEILIMTVIMYKLIVVVKNTRAAQVIFGLFALFMFWLFARAIGFNTITWIFSSFFSSFLVFTIIIFQEDIRRLLSTFGSGGFTPWINSHVDETESVRIIDEVAVSAKNLSHERLGALIVFERSVGIEKIYTHAIPLDAYITEQLLVAIFHSFSPLHDGAVIVKKNKILCASAHLPLTQNPRLGKKHGTRHSAALGISEQSDSVVVVVSEETGAISLAVAGVLYKQPSIDALKQKLRELMIPKRESSQAVILAERYFFTPANMFVLWIKGKFYTEETGYTGEDRRAIALSDEKNLDKDEPGKQFDTEEGYIPSVKSTVEMRFPGRAPMEVRLSNRMAIESQAIGSDSVAEVIDALKNNHDIEVKSEVNSSAFDYDVSDKVRNSYDDDNIDYSFLTQVDVDEQLTVSEPISTVTDLHEVDSSGDNGRKDLEK